MSVPVRHERRLLTRIEAAQYLGLTPDTLAEWAKSGRNNLPFVRLGTRRIAYRMEDLEAWVANRVTISSSDPISK